MTPLGFGELVHIARRSHGSLPSEITWRGRRHLVRSLESVAAPPRGRLREAPERTFYRMRTSTGLRLLLSEDNQRGLWRIERVLSS